MAPSGETFDERCADAHGGARGRVQDLQRRPSQSPRTDEPDRVGHPGQRPASGGDRTHAAKSWRVAGVPSGFGSHPKLARVDARGRAGRSQGQTLRRTEKGGLISRERGTSLGSECGRRHVETAGVVDAELDRGSTDEPKVADDITEERRAGWRRLPSGSKRRRTRSSPRGPALPPIQRKDALAGSRGRSSAAASRAGSAVDEEHVRRVRAAHQLVVLLREQGARERAH